MDTHGDRVLRGGGERHLGPRRRARSRASCPRARRDVVRRRRSRRAARRGPRGRAFPPTTCETGSRSTTFDLIRSRCRRRPSGRMWRSDLGVDEALRGPVDDMIVSDPSADRRASPAALRRRPPVIRRRRPTERAMGAPGLPFPNYTFDTFVPGPSNRFAHAAAMAVAEAPPSKAYNPLFIYGGVGLGKTHLLVAIGHHMHRLAPRLRVKYVTSREFMAEFIKAVRERQGYQFRPTLPRRRRAARRRHPVPGQARGDADRVLPHVQRAARGRPPDRDRVGPAAAGVSGMEERLQQPVPPRPVRRRAASRPRDADRDPAAQGPARDDRTSPTT